MSRQIISFAQNPEVALAAAEAAVTAGGCIVCPTDTVYGIGADPFSAHAVSRLLEAKGRGRDMPVPVLIADPEMVDALAESVPAPARSLTEVLWPGALTLILTARPGLALDVGDTGGSIAVRVPDHEATRALLRRTGPLAVSSANRSGQTPATTCESAVSQLGYAVAVYIDGGPTPGTRASTIVDFHSHERGVVRRRGALEVSAVSQVAPLVTVSDG